MPDTNLVLDLKVCGDPTCQNCMARAHIELARQFYARNPARQPVPEYAHVTFDLIHVAATQAVLAGCPLPNLLSSVENAYGRAETLHALAKVVHAASPSTRLH